MLWLSFPSRFSCVLSPDQSRFHYSPFRRGPIAMALSSLLRTGSSRLTQVALARTTRAASSRAASTLATSTTGDNSTILSSILIANRGEIALYVPDCRRTAGKKSHFLLIWILNRRVGRTATQHGIKVTTLYTNPDSKAQHALSSPYAFNLGETAAYLDGDRIIEIAKREGCQGIHPGYGFVRG